MHMRSAMPLAASLLAALSVSGCLGVENMADFKAALGFAPLPAEVLAPVARVRASLTLASVEQPVAFSAQGSADPQSLPLDFAWDFGDGARSLGGEATHRYRAPDVYTVTLRATNTAGLEGLDSLLLTVVENRPPVAARAILRGEEPVERALAGEELTFRSAARDPEGEPLGVRWDFGDGSVALTPDAAHAYARGGRYTVTLRAEDPAGLAASASRSLAVDQVLAERGSVALLDDARAHGIDVAAQAKALVAVVGFDPALGLNALALSLLDAEGREVARAGQQPPPLAQGDAAARLEVGAETLAQHKPGAWSLLVTRASGLQVDYRITAEVRY